MSQKESLLYAWVKLSSILKNNRITKGLMYNEAIVMLFLYSRFLADGEGKTSFKEVLAETGMLKSLLNRTVNSLEKKGLLERWRDASDRRMLYLKCVKEKLDVFLAVHNSSLSIAQGIIDIVGKEDADAFIRIVNKLEKAGYRT